MLKRKAGSVGVCALFFLFLSSFLPFVFLCCFLAALCGGCGWLFSWLACLQTFPIDSSIQTCLRRHSCQMVEPSAWNYSRELNFRSRCFLVEVSRVSDILFHGLPWNLPAVIHWLVFWIVGRLSLFISAFGIQLPTHSFTCPLIGQDMIKVESFISASFAMFTILVRHFWLLICTKQAASAKTGPFWRYSHLHLLSSMR